jgi:MFS superfamily sulfate permease-like transporter
MFRDYTKELMENIRGFRYSLPEISGSLGDMGTFIPLLVGMVTVCGLNVASALVFAGIFNILTGISFGIPMPVQPMKAIATVAIAEGLTEHQILAAGIVTGAIIFTLGLTNLIGGLNRGIPFSVVRGLQLGLGMRLLMDGINMVAGTNRLLGYDSISVGILCALLVLLLFFHTRFPGALVVFTLGLCLVLAGTPGTLNTFRLELTLPSLVLPSRDDFTVATLKAAVPQIPLTTLNSVIAVCALSRDLFPDKAASPRKVATSVGLMNLIGCWFGAMPMCHGAGGLAGQYRFGARTGGSVVFLGMVKIFVGLLLGAWVLELLAHYPMSVLGVLLTFSGLELALTSRDIRTRTDSFVMLLTAATILALKSTALGFLVGLCLAYLFFYGVLKIEKVEEAS